MSAETTAPHAIEIRDLTVSYGPRPALLDISLAIEPGLLVGVIGPNGSGKSTLIRTILGFLQPDIGEIRLFGQKADEAVGRVAYVPQRSAVDWDFPITVRQVVMMGRYGKLKWWQNPGRRDLTWPTARSRRMWLNDTRATVS